MNWKSLFVEDGPVSVKETSPVSNPKPVAAPNPPASTTHIETAMDVSGGFVDLLRSHFSESPFHSQIEEFTQTFDSLSDSIPEEGSRFRAAMKVLEKRSGLTADKLGAAFQSYTGILEQQSQNFNATMEQFSDKEVKGREEQIRQLNAQIESKNAETKALMDTRDGIALEKLNAENKKNSTRTGFAASVTVLSNEITDRLNKIRLYLPVTTPASSHK